VKNHRPKLNKKTLGITTIAVGVPLVTYAGTIAKDYLMQYGKKITAHEKDDYYKNTVNLHELVVTPKEINVIVEKCSDIIASAINRLVNSRQ